MATEQAGSGARNTYVDALKGYAIFMVVLGHALQRAQNYGLISVPTALGAYLPFQGWVTMPLFFAVSGFLCFGRVRVPRLKWLGDKARMLLIPWAAWTLAYYFLDKDPLWSTSMPIGKYALTQMATPSLWYFITLFEIYACVAVCLTLGEWALPVFGVLLLALLRTPLSQPVQYYWWFVAGWYAARFSPFLVRWKLPLWAVTVPAYLFLLTRNLPAGSLRYVPIMALGAIGFSTFIVWPMMGTAAERWASAAWRSTPASSSSSSSRSSTRTRTSS